MGIEMPAEVKWLIPIVVGDSWPEGDETALQRLGEVWKQAATDVDEAMRQAEDAVRQATSHMDGEAAEAFKRYWEKFVKGEEATLPKMKDVSEKLATACRNCAMQIEYAKLSIIIALVVLAIQIAAMLASAVVSFGASTAGIVPAQLATRAGVQIVFRQLVQQLMQQVGRNLIGKLAMQVGIEVATSVATDLAVQGIQLAKGTRDSLDTSLTLDAAKSGLISGVVGAGVGAGMGKVLGDGLGDSIGKSIGRNAAEEALIGAGSALAEGALSEEGIQAKDVLFGATSGAVSGSVSGAKSGIEGLNADIDVPTAGDMPRPSAGDMPRPDGPSPSVATPSPAAPSSTPDTEAPPRRSSDATNMSYAAPPVEQPQHRATPDATPASSAPPAAQQPQGFQQGSGPSGPASSVPAPASGAAPSGTAPQNAPAAPRSTPMSAASGFSPGGFSPSSSPSAPGGHPSGNSGPSPMSGGSSPGSAASHAPGAGGPSPSGSVGPAHGAPGFGPQHGPAPGGMPHGGPAPTGPIPGHGPGGSGSVVGGPLHNNGPAAHSGPVGGPHPNGGPLGPSPVGPAHLAPNQGPANTPQHRSPAGDAVQQAATSAPIAPAPFAAPPSHHHDAPPASQPPPPGHGPARQNFPPQQGFPPQQHRPQPQGSPNQAPRPQQTGRHAQQSGPPQRPQHTQAQGPQRAQTPPQGPHHTQAPQQHPHAPQRRPETQHAAVQQAPPPAQHRPAPLTEASQPHEQQARTPLEEFARKNRPVTLPDHLKHLQGHAAHTKAGLSLYEEAGSGHSRRDGAVYSATIVAPDPHRYTVDVHGSADNVRVGDTKLTPKDVADIIRASGDWDGKQPIRLLSCQTGTKPDGFAAQLSKELGVEVVAPTKDAWVDDMGNVFASSTHYDHKRGGDSPGWPPNGDWATFKPDGTSSKHDRSTAPGSTPTWGDDVPEQGVRAHRRGEPMVWVQDRFGNAIRVPASHVAPPHQVRQPPPPPPPRQWGPQPNRGQRPPLPPPPPPPGQGRRPIGPPPGPMPPRFPQQGPVPQRFPQPPLNQPRPPMPPQQAQQAGRPLPPNPGQQQPNWQPPAPGRDWRPVRPLEVSEVQWHRPGDERPDPVPTPDQRPEPAPVTEQQPLVQDVEPIRDAEPAPAPDPAPAPEPAPKPKPQLPPSPYTAKEDPNGIKSAIAGCAPPEGLRGEWAQKAHDLRQDAIAKGATDYPDAHTDEARAHGTQAAPDGAALHYEDISDQAAWRISQEELYRFDDRHPSVVFDDGFQVREDKQGGSTHDQVASNSGRMVSTTRDGAWYTSKQFGGKNAPETGQVAYNYVIDAPGGLDVLATLEREGNTGLLKSVDQEAEIGFLGGIDRRFVKEAVEVRWDGTKWVPTSNVFTNPHYEPHTTDVLRTTS